MKRNISLLLAGSLFWACTQEVNDEAEHGHTRGPGDTQQHEGTILDAQVIAATDYAPEYIQHATNIKIIPEVKTGLAYFPQVAEVTLFEFRRTERLVARYCATG